MIGMSGVAALTANAVLGGAASVAGGGKFANGAITGAFGYLFNKCGSDPGHCGFGQAIGAIGDGAYSTVAGVGNVVRWIARSAGLFGSDEFWRSDKEFEDTVKSIWGGARIAVNSQEARYEAYRVAVAAGKSYYIDDELHDYQLAGRMLMGAITGLGPWAMFGDATRAIERGHNAWDAAIVGFTGDHKSP
jgi:hypothetical protein